MASLESPFAQMRPKSNMSKEMKAKLRQEYLGLGGSESTVSRWVGVAYLVQVRPFSGRLMSPVPLVPAMQAMSSNYFLWVIIFVAVLAVLSHLIGAI